MTFSKMNRIEQLNGIMCKFFNPDELSEMISDLDGLDFFEAPASVSHHGNYSGGLFDHSMCVTNCLVDLTKRLELKWMLPRSPYVVGMFHDLCKCDNYVLMPDEETDKEHWEYNNASVLTGHGEKSVIMLQQLMPLTLEEVMCIRWHMGAFDDKSHWNNYGQAVTQFNNVLYSHMADMMAARFFGV